jgi:hypothetical protein
MDAFPSIEGCSKRTGILKTRDELLKLSSSLLFESRDARPLTESLDKILSLDYPLPREFFLLKCQFDLGVDITRRVVNDELISFVLVLNFRFINIHELNPIATMAEVRVVERLGNGSADVIQLLELPFVGSRTERKILIENVNQSSYLLGISIFDVKGKRMIKREFVV